MAAEDCALERASPGRASGGPSWRESVLATTIVLLATVPFLTKPFHIDDPADLQYVRQILRHPLDSYGFEVDWDEGPRPAFRNYHPPLKYYYQAIVLAALPLSEFTLHASYIPFVALTAWAILRIARRFRCPPIVLLALWSLGPGYLPGQNAMLDVPAVALGITATALFIEAVDKDRMARLAFAGVVLGAALLTKYSAAIYLPVWVGYLAARGRARHWFSLAAPLVLFALWCGWSAWRYGEVHPRILIERVPGHETSAALVQRLMPAAVFLGGSMPAAFLLLWARGWRGKVVPTLAGLATLIAALMATPVRKIVGGSTMLSSINFIWWCALAMTGFGVVLCSVWSAWIGCWRRSPDRPGENASRVGDEPFLAWWFLVALVLGVAASPFLAMRRVIEAGLPGWMLLLRRHSSGSGSSRVAIAVGVAANCVLGFLVASADAEFARVYPRFATDLAEMTRANPSRVWCHGYWGWSYYAPAAGLPHYVLGGNAPPLGGLLVIPEEVAKPASLPDDLRHGLVRVHEETRYGKIPIRLMSYQAGAGYYSSSWGPLPYAWSMMPLEVFDFFEMKEPPEQESASRRP